MVAGITKVGPENQLFYEDEQCMEKDKPLTKYDLNGSTAKARAPAAVPLAFRDPCSVKFETVEVAPLSSPPELPDVMKIVALV